MCRYSQAKALGQEVNTSRVNISMCVCSAAHVSLLYCIVLLIDKLKSLLDKMKVQNGM